jgi:hypothetical protein
VTNDITNLSDEDWQQKMIEMASQAEEPLDGELPPTPPAPPTAPTTPPPGPQPEDPRQTLARISRNLHRDNITRFEGPTQADMVSEVVKWATATPGLVVISLASSVDERGNYWTEFRYIIR